MSVNVTVSAGINFLPENSSRYYPACWPRRISSITLKCCITGVRHGEDAKRVVNKDGDILFDRTSNASSLRPEVDRGELRAMLISSLPRGTIRWGCKVTSLKPLGDGRHQIDFVDGANTVVDLLVGADGAWSRVRPLLTDARPLYSGTCFIEIALTRDDARHTASILAIGTGTLMAAARSNRHQRTRAYR